MQFCEVSVEPLISKLVWNVVFRNKDRVAFVYIALFRSDSRMQDLLSNAPISYHRHLLQDGTSHFRCLSRTGCVEYSNSNRVRSESQENNLVGLAVLAAVAVLFLLNICLCVWKLLHIDDRGRNSASDGRSRIPEQGSIPNARSLPVIFVNPGGSLRVGQTSKHGMDGSDIGRLQGLPDTADRYYYFDEVELADFNPDDLDYSPTGPVDLPQTSPVSNPTRY